MKYIHACTATGTTYGPRQDRSNKAGLAVLGCSPSCLSLRVRQYVLSTATAYYLLLKVRITINT